MRSRVVQGMEQCLWRNHILFKDYLDHVKGVSRKAKQASVKPFENLGLPVQFLRGPGRTRSRLRAIRRRAKSGKRFGSAHSTSFPFPHSDRFEWTGKAVASNGPGRVEVPPAGQLLRLDRDYAQAQKLKDQQLEIDWADLLNVFGGQLNPLHESIFEHYPTDYYFTCYQSEWATDIVFAKADFLRRPMPLLPRHGVLSFSSAGVMRYFGRKVNQSGDIPAGSNGTLETDLKRRQQGERVKYRMNGNSARFYDKAYSEIGSVLRGAETTINAVEDFRAFRPKEGGPEEDLQWRPLRKGIADLHRRAEVSQKANDRLLNALASVDDSRSVEELTADMQKPVHWSRWKVRGLRPW